MEFYFLFEKNWSGQNRSSWTVSTCPEINTQVIYNTYIHIHMYNTLIESGAAEHLLCKRGHT